MTKYPDPRDDPQSWMDADPTLSLADAEWYAKHWRERHSRIEYRDPDDPGSGVTRRPRPARNDPVGCA